MEREVSGKEDATFLHYYTYLTVSHETNLGHKQKYFFTLFTSDYLFK